MELIDIYIERIIDFLKDSHISCFTAENFRRLLISNRETWNIPSSISARKVLIALLRTKKIEESRFTFPFRPQIIYSFREESLYETLMGAYPRAYYSYLTAAFFHELIEEEPKTIFLNYEQQLSRTQNNSSLSQESIDNAFKNRGRITSNILSYDNYKIMMLLGKQTGNAGVLLMDTPLGNRLRVTSIERTLIDMVVRPFHSGGSKQVLLAFRAARGTFSVSNLKILLEELKYTYPYHQAVGFYLEAAGVYSEDEITQFRKIDKSFDFYLEHAMKKSDYSKEWRIYFPDNLIK